MKTIATINEQDAVVTSISMNRASGYGQYSINIQFTWNGEDFNTNIRSTDSRAFDNMNDADDTMEFLLIKFANTIEDVVSDLVSEYIERSGQHFAKPVLPPIALDGFLEVSQDEFYKIVGPLDATLSTLGNYPFTTEFKLRYGRLIGKSVDSYEGEYLWPVVTRYYISCNWR